MLGSVNWNAKHQVREWHKTEQSSSEVAEMLQDDSSVALCKAKCDVVEECLTRRYTSSEMMNKNQYICVNATFRLFVPYSCAFVSMVYLIITRVSKCTKKYCDCIVGGWVGWGV